MADLPIITAGECDDEVRDWLAEHGIPGFHVHYTTVELEKLPVLSQGQADDLHVEVAYASGITERVWLSRAGWADGEPFDNAVTHEYLVAGRWIEVERYPGGPSDDGYDVRGIIAQLRSEGMVEQVGPDLGDQTRWRLTEAGYARAQAIIREHS